MNKIKTALAGLSILSMLTLLFLAGAVSAQTPLNANSVASSALAQVATATPEAGMMEHPTATPDPSMGMMEHPTATPDAAMMSTNGTMTNSSLPATGSSDNSTLLVLLVASAVTLLGGLVIRRAITHLK